MRVLIASLAHFCDIPGGVQRRVHEEALELRERGWDVWVLATGSSSLPEHELRDGIHLLRYVPERVAAWNPARRSAHQIAASAVLQRHLPKVDAIHGHAPLAYLAALGVYGDDIHSCYTMHSPAKLEMAIAWRNSGFLRRLAAPFGLAVLNRIERECLRRSHVVRALSQFTVSCIAMLHGEALASSVVLAPGWCETGKYVPLENRVLAKEQLGWPVDVPVLFTLRRLVPRMGLDRLLNVSHRLQQRNTPFHLVIGGEGPYRKTLEDQSRTLGLSGQVTFMGRIDDEMLPTAYGACDAFVLPTAELECFGLIALEALAAGRPVLATPVGAIPEIVAGFEPAWLSRSASVEDLSDLLSDYLAGSLPQHSPIELHRRTHLEYGRWKLLPASIDSAIGVSSSVAID